MRYRKLDENYDMCFGRGVSDYLEDSVGNPYAVAQAIKTRLLLFYGEWWENITNGLPMWQEILGQRVTDKSIIDRILIDNILGLRLPDPDNRYAVTRVVSSSSTYNSVNRAYTFTAEVDTIYGKLIITNEEVQQQRYIPTGSLLSIIQQPQDITVNEGETARFDVIVRSDSPVGYQWLRRSVGAVKWSYILDATSSFYITPPTVKSTDDQSEYKCIISNSTRSIISDSATLTVLDTEFLVIAVDPEDESEVSSVESVEVTFNKNVDEETIIEDNINLDMDELRNRILYLTMGATTEEDAKIFWQTCVSLQPDAEGDHVFAPCVWESDSAFILSDNTIGIVYDMLDGDERVINTTAMSLGTPSTTFSFGCWFNSGKSAIIVGGSNTAYSYAQLGIRNSGDTDPLISLVMDRRETLVDDEWYFIWIAVDGEHRYVGIDSHWEHIDGNSEIELSNIILSLRAYTIATAEYTISTPGYGNIDTLMFYNGAAINLYDFAVFNSVQPLKLLNTHNEADVNPYNFESSEYLVPETAADKITMLLGENILGNDCAKLFSYGYEVDGDIYAQSSTLSLLSESKITNTDDVLHLNLQFRIELIPLMDMDKFAFAVMAIDKDTKEGYLVICRENGIYVGTSEILLFVGTLVLQKDTDYNLRVSIPRSGYFSCILNNEEVPYSARELNEADGFSIDILAISANVAIDDLYEGTLLVSGFDVYTVKED